MAKRYDFKYKVYWKNGEVSNGSTENSPMHPKEIFLNNNFICFNNGCCTYFNREEIRNIEITDFKERDEENG